jgi:DNA-directed RNA polymerase alpha subunit
MDKVSNIFVQAKKKVNKTPKTLINLSASGADNKFFMAQEPWEKSISKENYKQQSLFNKFWICCKESRIESPNSFYGCFYMGPFDESLSQTLAHNIRRTLLSELSGIAITAVEIEGVLHKFSNLPGIQETVLDILCNLQNIVLSQTNQNLVHVPIGYLRVRGPGVVKASDFLLPSGIQCVNPEQYIATLNEDGVLNMKIFINEGKNYIKQKPKNSFKQVNLEEKSESIQSTGQNRIYLDSVFMPVTKVNTMVQNNNKCTDNLFENNIRASGGAEMFKINPEFSINTYSPEGSLTATNTDKHNTNYDENSNETETINFKNARVSFNSDVFGKTSSFYKSQKKDSKGIDLQSGLDTSFGFYKAPLFRTINSSTVQNTTNPLESFITLSEIKKKQQTKQCHIIIEIWTNGSIHPRTALSNCLNFLSRTFGILENVKILGSMFKSDVIYGKVLSQNTKVNIKLSGNALANQTNKFSVLN